MLFIHFTPESYKGSLESKNAYRTGNVISIFREGLRPHSSVCTPEHWRNFIHHGFRSNRKNLWGSIVVRCAVVVVKCDNYDTGPDAEGHFFIKSKAKALAWTIIEVSNSEEEIQRRIDRLMESLG